MGKFLSCGLITAFAILSTAIKVCAEPPPVEPVVIYSEQLPPADNSSQASQLIINQ